MYDEHDFMTVAEVAELLRLSKHAVTWRIQRGVYKGAVRDAGRRYLIPRQSVLRTLELVQGQQPAPPPATRGRHPALEALGLA
jgi:excisionase family DNA binding protein